MFPRPAADAWCIMHWLEKKKGAGELGGTTAVLRRMPSAPSSTGVGNGRCLLGSGCTYKRGPHMCPARCVRGVSRDMAQMYRLHTVHYQQGTSWCTMW